MEILDEALRGGEPARLLEEQCKKRLADAEKEVQDALEAAPEFVAETTAQHEAHLKEIEALETQLVMLGESLDDLTKNSSDMLERSRRDDERRKALDDLSVAIVPYLHIANALNQSLDMHKASFPNLEATLFTLHTAAAAASASPHSILQRAAPELSEREDQLKATMKSRFLDTFEIRPHCIIAKAELANDPEFKPLSAPKALSNVDLLKDSIDAIVSELLRNDVAASLSRATSCQDTERDSAFVLEWTKGGDDSAELLEFDFDDIEVSTEVEVDAMSENLDIANAAARALRVYDLLRLKVLGEEFSRDLAFALQSWFCNQVLPSSIVMSSRRSSNNAEPLGDALHSRVAAVSASANIIQSAIRARGVESFVLIVEMDSLESKVGSECRAQAVLKARRAIASFANAGHDNEEIVACPIASENYVAPSERTKEYFAPCLVTKTGVVVHNTFLATRKDAVNAAQGGSEGIATALNSAALECLRAYREDVPVQYGDELRSSLRLKALYYTDCMMCAHSCRLSVDEGSKEGREMMEEVESLENAAQKAMAVVRRTAERRLEENLNAACRNGALGAYGTLTRIQRSSALSAAYHAMREVVSVFAQIVSTELAEVAACRLLEKYLTKLCNEVVGLREISAEGCAQIDAILGDADRNVGTLMEMVSGMEAVRNGAAGPPAVEEMRSRLRRLRTIREILSARMEDIVRGFQKGRFDGVVSREEVEHFVCAIFEDTEMRASFIADLRVSVGTEGPVETEWNNAEW